MNAMVRHPIRAFLLSAAVALGAQAQTNFFWTNTISSVYLRMFLMRREVA